MTEEEKEKIEDEIIPVMSQFLVRAGMNMDQIMTDEMGEVDHVYKIELLAASMHVALVGLNEHVPGRDFQSEFLLAFAKINNINVKN